MLWCHVLLWKHSYELLSFYVTFSDMIILITIIVLTIAFLATAAAASTFLCNGRKTIIYQNSIQPLFMIISSFTFPVILQKVQKVEAGRPSMLGHLGPKAWFKTKLHHKTQLCLKMKMRKIGRRCFLSQLSLFFCVINFASVGIIMHSDTVKY